MVLQDERNPFYVGWRVVAASSVAIAFGPSTILTFGLGLFMRPLQASFGWTRTDVALAATIVSLMTMVLAPVQGLLIDRFGVRRVMLISIPAFALGIASLSLTPRSLPAYYAAWTAIPILGIGLFGPAYFKSVSGWFDQRLGLALGITNSGTAIGGMVIPPIIGGLIALYGWRIAAVGLGLLVVTVTLPAAALFIREKRTEPAPGEATVPPSGVSYAQAVRTPTFLLLALCFLLCGATTIALITQQAPLLIDRGMAPFRAALVMTSFGAFGVLGRLLTGLLLDRIRAPLVMAVLSLAGAVGCVLYAVDPVPAAFVSSAFLGLLFGAEFDILAYIIKSQFGIRAFGKLYGTIFAVFQLSNALGAAFLAICHDRFGGYGPGLWIFAALLAGAAAVMLCLLATTSSHEAAPA
jgi:MFS family permease